MVQGTECRVIPSACALGGGTTPTETIHRSPSKCRAMPATWPRRYLRLSPPIAGRIVNDRYTIEVRTLGVDYQRWVAKAIRP